MIRDLIRRALPLVLAVALLMSLPLAAGASEHYDLTRPCAITVTLRDLDTTEPIPGSKVELFHVGMAYEENGALCYALTPEFASSGLPLNDLNAEGLAQKFADFAKDLTGTTGEANEKGDIVFENLTAGVYLALQREAVEGYLRLSPFLVSLPMYGEEGWQYDVAAGPKVVPTPAEPEKLTVVKRWQVNSDKDISGSVTVALLRDGEEFDEVELSKNNKWTHTWTGLDPYYIWTVKEADVPKGFTAKQKTSGHTVTITNRANNYVPPKDPDKLIQTGQLNWPVPVLASAGMLLALIGVICIRRGKDENA